MLSFFKNKDLSNNVDATYCIIVDQSRNPSFYKELLVPDNIDGRFDVLTLQDSFRASTEPILDRLDTFSDAFDVLDALVTLFLRHLLPTPSHQPYMKWSFFF